MRAHVVFALVMVAAIVGLVAGALVGRGVSSNSLRATPARGATGIAASPSARRPWDAYSRRDDEPNALRGRRERDGDNERGGATSDEIENHERRDREVDDGSGDASIAGDGVPRDEVERLTRELASLKRENAELRDEHAELLGEPVPEPSDIEPRFSAPSLTVSVGQAIGQAGVEGKVEHVDCSEYPCITFGRLAGDEEDMEEIERAAALSPYDADVLTLLFWATSVDSSESPGTKETGLFALAFYSQDDRATDGVVLDRRIRARTVEYWNTDKPARPPAAALD